MNANRTALYLALTLATTGTAATAVAAATPACPAGTQVSDAPLVCRSTQVYREASKDDRGSLDIYYDPAKPTADVVVFVPGGAWTSGDKSTYEDLGIALAGQHGLTTVAINYRLSERSMPQGKGTGPARKRPVQAPIQHPAHVQDVAAAFAWVKREIAPYGNAERVFLFGQSAGAHLSSLMATDEQWLAGVPEGCSAAGAPCTLEDIRGVVSMSAAYDLPSLATASERVGLDGLQAQATALAYRDTFKDAFGDDPEVWEDASPIAHIGPHQPPFLVLYSFDDMPQFARESQRFGMVVDAMLHGRTGGSADSARMSSDDPLSDPVLVGGPIDVEPIEVEPLPLPAQPAATPTGLPLEVRRIERTDYSPQVWAAAGCLASGGTLNDDRSCARPGHSPNQIYTGHYAEVVAINPYEPDSYPTRLVVDFVRSH